MTKKMAILCPKLDAFWVPIVLIENRKKMADRRKLEIGPAIAILNSALGCGGSPFICAIPPKMNRVILVIGIWYFLAIYEWESSWNATEAKSSKAANVPLIQ